MLETTLHPRSPYSLAASCAGESDATRRFSGGVLRAALRTESGPALARVWQRPDGALAVRVESGGAEEALAALRFLLAVDCDDRPFRQQARADPLMRELVRRRPGLRPLRLGTVTHALLRALAGQRIAWGLARRIENRVLRALEPGADLVPPPLPADIGRLGPARAERLGLSPARAAALTAIARRDDPERLRRLPEGSTLPWALRRPHLGPWSAGVIGMWGVGSFAHGLVGDLGLIKLCAALSGRPAEPADTQLLLAPWGEWAGLASRYLLTHPMAGGQRYREALDRRRFPARMAGEISPSPRSRSAV
jgi:3-methyladenine DNA glycosylase/8-oxoguanine DNA glycosylase